MARYQTHAEDCGEILKEELAAGRLGRRQVLGLMAALGATTVLGGLGSRAASAASGELVLCNWGGDAVKAFTEAFKAHYDSSSSLKMVVEGGGPSSGKVRAMVEAKNVIWDVCDSGAGDSIVMGKAGVLEEMDYTIIDKAKMIPGFAYETGCINYTFGVVLAYNAEKYKDNPPKTMADFFDLKKYPGRRMLRKRALAMLECALLADGVPMDKVYPIDVDRALKKIGSIKSESLYWSSGAESQQLLRSGECDMGLLWHTRAHLLKRDSEGRIDWTFNQGILHPGMWIVPKGNPAGKKAAMEAIASMQAPEGQVKLLELMANGPANPAASDMVPAELKPINPSDPANQKVMLASDGRWWGEHAPTVEQKYADLISS